MLAATRSELVRLRRPRLLAGWFGLMGLFAIMINTVMFTAASRGTAPPAGGPGVSFPSAAALAASGGLVAGLSAASNIFGVVTLSFWAVVTATDYSTGLVRLLAAAQPHRWRLVVGKVAALTIVTVAATTVATVVNLIAAWPAARGAGISTSAWTTNPVGAVASTWLNTFAALLVWGVIGLVLAVLARSSAVAISVGVGYVLVVESIVKMAMSGSSDWLPGSTLNALARGGTASLSYAAAGALALLYVTISLGLALTVVTRRDITD